MTYEELTKANESIQTTSISRSVKDKKTGQYKEVAKEYAEVPQRVKAFRMIFPNGNIRPVRDYLDGEVGHRIVGFTAYVYDENGKELASGSAEEKEDSSQVNRTSFIENCETSAVGRALGFLGIGSAGSIASLEEVNNAIEIQKSIEELTNKVREMYTEEDIAKTIQRFGVQKLEDLSMDTLQRMVTNKK